MASTVRPPVQRFATLVPAAPERRRWGIAQLFSAPFRDVDHRVALKAASDRAEREARELAAMAEVEPQPH